MKMKVRFWFWVYCKLNMFYARIWRYYFLKYNNPKKGILIAKISNWIYENLIRPNMPVRTSKENWRIICGDDDE